jgi:two-component system response regulator MprA
MELPEVKGRVNPDILVVEDDAAIRQTLADVLSFEGYAVRLASGGAEALDMIEQARPGLILLDLLMPHMDGWALASEIRERNLPIPILVITAASGARTGASEIAADGFLSKPFDLRDLLDQIRRLYR